MIKNEPKVCYGNCGDKVWEQEFNFFTARVYVPKTDLPEDVVNFGYSAPYLLYFDDCNIEKDEIAACAEKMKLTEVARQYGTSVVFISPKNEGGWAAATDELFLELISNSKIHQYYKNGYAILNNRFTNTCDGYAIRGAIFKTILIGKNSSADYIATHLLKKLTGDGLWGAADVAPTVCVLNGLSVSPDFQRDDMPVVSINNSADINQALENGTKYFYEAKKDESFPEIYNNFAGKFKRWGWDGELQSEPDFAAISMIEEPCFAEVKMSPDNSGDDAGADFHKIGYISYYNKGLFSKGHAPLLMCFHGGGDSAKHIAQVSEWYKVAHDHDFLLVCVENHINSTATEMMELLEILKKQYPIDSTRIYASGFSMGGCKSWDLYQEFPKVFAGLAPMDATFEVGLNVYGQPVPCKINENELVPIFYVGGEITPLPELPFQAEKCWDRMRYVFDVNHLTTKYDVKFEDKENWENKIWGISGDKIEVVHDDSRNSDLTMNYFKSADGEFYTVFASVSGQGHECRYHSCEYAWKFISQFKRVDGKICKI